MNTDYRLLAERLGEFGMEQKRIPYFIGLMQNSDKAFPMGDEDQKWALSRGFVPDKIDLYHLNEENAHLWISDFDYLMMHPLNNHFKFWIDDKLTLKYMLNSEPLKSLMPDYYLYVENDGRYTYLMDMPSDVPCNDGCLLSLLERKGTLAIKPNRGTGGAGFVKLELLEGGHISANNVVMSQKEFRALQNNLNGCIVTEYVHQHDNLSKVWSGSECSLRIIMVKNVSNDKYVANGHSCILSYARFGTSQTGGASNLCQGGIGVPFDFETGLLNGIGVKYKTNRDERYRFDGHPDTGVSFEGFFLPCYDQVKKLSSTRARTFPLWIILDSTSSSRKTAESSSARSTAFPK